MNLTSHMFRAKIMYDGTCYFGWQETRAGPSIQESLSNALLQATQEKVSVEAASRTDRGVHAEGQVIGFALQRPWEEKKLLLALNAHLPKDIRVREISEAPNTFHPTLDAKGKEYHYYITHEKAQYPMDRLYAWHWHRPLDLARMEQGAELFLGTHSFSSFASGLIKNPICTLSEIRFEPIERKRLRIALKGDRFLYTMARTIVGTLIYIGARKREPECVKKLLEVKDRPASGMTAPAHGLFLHRVIYS